MWLQKRSNATGVCKVGDSAEKMQYPNFQHDVQDAAETIPFNFEREIAEPPAIAEQEPVDEGIELTQQVDWNRNWELPESLPTLTQYEPLVKKRASVAKRAVLLMSGLAIGMTLAVSVMQDSSEPARSVNAAPIAATSAVINIDAVDPRAKELIGDSDISKTVAPPKSGAAEFAINQPFKIAIRDYLYLKNTGRFFGAELDSAQSAVAPSSLKVSAPVLNKIPGEEARFQPSSSNLQWQGGFKAEDAERNIQLGAAYQDYLKNTLGAGEFENLSSFQRGSSNLLSQIKRSPASKGLRKHK
jgi:hypothetical protein